MKIEENIPKEIGDVLVEDLNRYFCFRKNRLRSFTASDDSCRSAGCWVIPSVNEEGDGDEVRLVLTDPSELLNINL